MGDCANINECSPHGEESEARHNCDSNAMCTDTTGSFNCQCVTGYSGDGVQCTGSHNMNKTHLNILTYQDFPPSQK